MKQSEFKKRRAALMKQIGKGNIAIIGSAPYRTRNRDVLYPFRQDSDFFYLTGFNESDSLAVFIPGREKGEYVLFCREYDEKKALWEDAHAGLEGAAKHKEADDSFPIDYMDDILPGMLENKSKVFYPMGKDSELDHKLLEWINHIRKQSRTGVTAPGELVSLEHIVHEMRLFKTGEELMRCASQVSARAHRRAMQYCKPGLYEYQVEAELIHDFVQDGLRAVEYRSIVAGGKNACVLQYIENKDKLNKTVDKIWRGIGIRIEDDVLVTTEGHEVLTDAVPKSVEAIEALMRGD